MYKYFPSNRFNSYEEYTEYLKMKGFAIDIPNKNNNIMETTSVYIVYATDDWGKRKGIAGIYKKKEIAIEHIINYYRENNYLTESELQEARNQLIEFYQTQGIIKADNFEIDVRPLNEWDW